MFTQSSAEECKFLVVLTPVRISRWASDVQSFLKSYFEWRRWVTSWGWSPRKNVVVVVAVVDFKQTMSICNEAQECWRQIQRILRILGFLLKIFFCRLRIIFTKFTTRWRFWGCCRCEIAKGWAPYSFTKALKGKFSSGFLSENCQL